ncbi:D-aminoacyl-tRNA deacylase [Gemmatimonadota bacterium]
MKALIQRVKEAEVRVADEVVGTIGPGMLVLLGVGREDTEESAGWLAAKCAHLRIFDDVDDKMNRSLIDTGGSALVVSQFTLYADTRKGRRPSYEKAANPEDAIGLVEAFCSALEQYDVPVSRGRFGATMDVHLVNDGPVTLMVETPA